MNYTNDEKGPERKEKDGERRERERSRVQAAWLQLASYALERHCKSLVLISAPYSSSSLISLLTSSLPLLSLSSSSSPSSIFCHSSIHDIEFVSRIAIWPFLWLTCGRFLLLIPPPSHSYRLSASSNLFPFIFSSHFSCSITSFHLSFLCLFTLDVCLYVFSAQTMWFCKRCSSFCVSWLQGRRNEKRRKEKGMRRQWSDERMRRWRMRCGQNMRVSFVEERNTWLKEWNENWSKSGMQCTNREKEE